MWKIKDQPSNSTSCSDNALCLSFLWHAIYIEDFKWCLHFQFGVALGRAILREVYFEGPNRIWRAMKTSILNIVGRERVAKGKREANYNRTSLIQQSRYYDTFLHDQTFKFKSPSFIQLRHSIMRHLKSPFCIREVVNAKIHHGGEHLTS
jgi:hypothetical protein